MKAIELQRPGLDGIAHVDRAPQGLGSGEIRVRIRAAAINYRDLFIAQGHYPIEYPRIPFSDAAGEVIDVAPDVSRVSVGDRVCPIFFPDWLGGPFDSRQFGRDLGGAIDGVLADEFVTSAEAVVRVPGHLSDVEASTLPCAALTAWSALTEHVTVRPGYRVVIEGTGGVSIAALQFAK